MICKYCGKQIPDDSIYCFYCDKAVAPTSTTTKVKGKREKVTSGGGGLSFDFKKIIIIGIVIILILAVLFIVGRLFFPAFDMPKNAVTSEIATDTLAVPARSGISISRIFIIGLIAAVLLIAFIFGMRAKLGKPVIIVAALVLLAIAALFILTFIGIKGTPANLFGSNRVVYAKSRFEDDSYDSPEETEAAFGCEAGYRCYSDDLPIIYGNSTPDGTIDPTKTGKVTVIYFWGTWCTPSINELSYYDHIADRYPDEVAVIAIHTAIAGNTASDFIAENYPNSRMFFCLDEENDFYYTQLGGLGSYPYTVILDENGVIAYVDHGSLSFSDLSAIVETNVLY